MVLGGFLPDASPVHLVILLVTTVMTWFGSAWLESPAEHLPEYYQLPAVVQGPIVDTVASSFPELASVVKAQFYSRQLSRVTNACYGGDQ
ncbi:MAG: hypothetical protein ABEH56_07420 [Salinirussus sp.]